METIGDLKSVKECPDCASVNVLFSQAREQVICRECGLIFEPFVPVEPLEKPRSTVSSQKTKQLSKGKPAKKAAKKPAKSSKKKRR